MSAAAEALLFVDSCSELPAPDIVSGENGSIQVEWHTDRFDLEVGFESDGKAWVYFCCEATGEEWEDGALGSPRLLKVLESLRGALRDS